jgi:lipid-A-disaccharide synthase
LGQQTALARRFLFLLPCPAAAGGRQFRSTFSSKDGLMRVFVSAGEPSGDLHGANLIRALRRFRPDIAVDGFGGERMAAAGCSLLYPLSDMAIIGFIRVLASLNRFADILEQADRFFRIHRPDVLVLIDFPGFHWWLARSARERGIPVLYFIPPQLWAWGGWRARKMRRLVDRVLCVLPFEEKWYRQRHIPTTFVGHPYFDELRVQSLDGDFLAAERAKSGPLIGILPGSRRHELKDNTDALMRAAALIHSRRPDARFVAACLQPQHRDQVVAVAAEKGLPLEAHSGRTPEIIHLAHSCLAVSGSVSLELLHACTPSVILYKLNSYGMMLATLFKCCPYISLVNLLAGRELYPEFLTTRCPSEKMASHILRWLDEPHTYQALRGELMALRDRVCVPGACERAAMEVLHFISKPARRAA